LDHLRGILGPLAKGGQYYPAIRGKQLRRDDELAAGAVNLTGYHRLDPFTDGQLASQSGSQPSSVRLGHPSECLQHLLRFHRPDRPGLRKIDSECVGQRVTQQGVTTAVDEICQDHPLTVLEHARRYQRPHRTDPKCSQQHVAAG
jgi:hypothetical protein